MIPPLKTAEEYSRPVTSQGRIKKGPEGPYPLAALLCGDALGIEEVVSLGIGLTLFEAHIGDADDKCGSCDECNHFSILC
jgi:hypothetical protein